MTNIVFYTGAGMSRESDLPTFRGKEGIWEELDVEKVAFKQSWYCGRYSDCNKRRQAILDFFNPIRRLIMEKEPNEGHRQIASLEKEYRVSIITQNGDDYHERAGSANVIHLHGEALKNASTLHPYEWYNIDRNNPDIHIGDKAPDGSQIRPYVIFFDEDIEMSLWKKSVAAIQEANYFIVIGSSLLVHPAVDLLKMIPAHCKIYVIDPDEVKWPDGGNIKYEHLCTGASEGMRILCKKLFNQ